MIITEFGKIIRVHANEIREAGRSTQGVRLLRLEDGDKIAAAAGILEEEPNGEKEPPKSHEPNAKEEGRESEIARSGVQVASRSRPRARASRPKRGEARGAGSDQRAGMAACEEGERGYRWSVS